MKVSESKPLSITVYDNTELIIAAQILAAVSVQADGYGNNKFMIKERVEYSLAAAQELLSSYNLKKRMD